MFSPTLLQVTCVCFVAVAESGPEVLYSGEYAAQLVQEIAARGGVITEQDLVLAQPVIREPLRAHAMGVEIIAAPPPSSAASVITALKVLAGVQLCSAAVCSIHVDCNVDSHTVQEAVESVNTMQY